MDPVKGAKEGAKQSAGHAIGGFFKGVGQGLLGVVVKPTAAIVSGTATVMDGINHNVSLDTVARHVRLPRFLQDNIICDYSDREGLAKILVQSIQEHIPDTTLGTYIYHILCDRERKHKSSPGTSKKKTFLLMTSECIIHGALALAIDRDYSDTNQFKLHWNLPFHAVERLRLDGRKLALEHKGTHAIARSLSRTSSGRHAQQMASPRHSNGAQRSSAYVVDAAFRHEALVFARLFLRLKEEFQISARFRHQVRMWLASLDRKVPEKRCEVALRDPLLKALVRGGGQVGGDAGSKPSRSQLETLPEAASSADSGLLTQAAVVELFAQQCIAIESAYASGIERRNQTTSGFFGKRLKHYCVVKITVAALAYVDNVSSKLYLELTRTYSDFKSLRHTLRHTRHDSEKGVWNDKAEAIWRKIPKAVQEEDLHSFEQLVRCLSESRMLCMAANLIPNLWEFFTKDFHLIGRT